MKTQHYNEWLELSEKLKLFKTCLLSEPEISKESTQEKQAKIYLQDPSNSILEIKAYKHVSEVFGLPDDGYR